ncbi:50S ribosomal protein L24 [Oscillibacter sp.]|uniref:50S ribosomal protein L24 n=1 Tax=Oscillibacter sp. TaxID=1945593 RepID=UPI002898C296|nr:50S ribosomal protein L24 [Oscillibacter sp.]
MSMNIKKGDTVVVLSGKDRGKQGKVLGSVPKTSRVVVEGINIVTCHVKPRKQGETGGIVKREAAIASCKVQVICPKCSKGTRVAHKIENGKSVRVCKHCGAAL